MSRTVSGLNGVHVPVKEESRWASDIAITSIDYQGSAHAGQLRPHHLPAAARTHEWPDAFNPSQNAIIWLQMP
jgi:hypothetical protein